MGFLSQYVVLGMNLSLQTLKPNNFKNSFRKIPSIVQQHPTSPCRVCWNGFFQVALTFVVPALRVSRDGNEIIIIRPK